MRPPRQGGRRIRPAAARRDAFGVLYRQAYRTLQGRTSPSRRPLHLRVEQRAKVVPIEQKRTVSLDHGRVAKVVPCANTTRRCCSRSIRYSAARGARPTNVPRLAEAAKDDCQQDDCQQDDRRQLPLVRQSGVSTAGRCSVRSCWRTRARRSHVAGPGGAKPQLPGRASVSQGSRPGHAPSPRGDCPAPGTRPCRCRPRDRKAASAIERRGRRVRAAARSARSM